jgi:group I intron endonuclease
MGCGIYLIENLVNNKKYVGSSIDIPVRMMKHKYSLRRNYHDNNYLQNAYNKYGEDNFKFTVLMLCDEVELVDNENHFINKFKSNDLTFGYNLATVNQFRRNNYNEEVKIKNSKHNLKVNNNFIKFKSINLTTFEELVFDDLVTAANYLKKNNYSDGKLRNIRQKISQCLRGVIVDNGSVNNGAIRRTAYKHKWIIIQ